MKRVHMKPLGTRYQLRRSRGKLACAASELNPVFGSDAAQAMESTLKCRVTRPSTRDRKKDSDSSEIHLSQHFFLCQLGRISATFTSFYMIRAIKDALVLWTTDKLGTCSACTPAQANIRVP